MLIFEFLEGNNLEKSKFDGGKEPKKTFFKIKYTNDKMV